MFTTSPYLITRRPSPTTAEFIVTTRPPTTLTLRLLLLAVLLYRLLLAASVILLLHSKWATLFLSSSADDEDRGTTTDFTTPFHSPFTNSSNTSSIPPPLHIHALSTFLHNLHLAHSTRPGRLLTHLAALLPPSVLIPISLLCLYLSILRTHTTETLLVLRGLGVQTASSGRTFFSGKGTARFIPTEKIRDVLINEAFRGFEVRYYLVVVVEGEEDVVVVFPKLLPGREVVERVWRGVRGCLYEPGGGGGVGAVGKR